MKKKNRVLVYTLIVIGFFLIIGPGCTKDETSSDYASKITGTYNGTVTLVGTGSASCSSTINKNTETVVDLIILIGTTSIPLNGINVSSSGAVYNLSYTDSSGSFTGKVDGNTLTWTLTASGMTETFTGNR